MKFSNRSKIQDVKLFSHDKFIDNRGAIINVFNKNDNAGLFSDLGELNFIYQTLSKKDVLRGFHYQVERPQSRLMRVSYGAIYDVILDLRKASPTFGKWQARNFDFREPFFNLAASGSCSCLFGNVRICNR